MTKKGNKPDLLIISGPTASGKSSLAESLALSYQLPIISADSRQVYKGMNIGTAKPHHEVLSTIDYHLIDILEPNQTYAAGKFNQNVFELLDGELSSLPLVIIAGGTAFYIQALIEGLADIPDIRPEILSKWNDIWQKKGIQYLQNMLKEQDPEYSHWADMENPHRIIRALTILDQTGKSITQFQKGRRLKGSYSYKEFAIHRERSDLYHRINERVDNMVKEGLIEEVKSLSPYFNYEALNTVGYKEVIQFFKGEKSKDEAIAKIKQHTRNFAKRQMTWFRKHGNWEWINPGEDKPLHEWIKTRL
ncbi:tRNA (adenosine(37)-N6)-dimethylallyltransferase MiaA [Membranihabitans maritimus]|uniref:tRNA (adenosine(37)-N6)-dimethylallyltransferase MiaA n=1 Tax=Membranihabitans maritimus TaxID=2904244 RepID=UPI001F0318A8|nr:tRNA (adenosine(37)-N6)-dimethylallyltransferase MiaA [Membranihabitans maritimus]